MAIHQSESGSHHTPVVQVPTEHGDTVDWEQEIKILEGQLDEAPEKHTIFRLPAWYTETNKHLYEPKMVAIGPYHHHNENLKAMQHYKLRSVQNVCQDVSVNVCIDKMRALEQKARDCYSEYVPMQSLDFVRMLLFDGCFIIDYFEKLRDRKVDPICNVGWAKIHLYSDLFLLENQIPFFVIHELITLRDSSHDCQKPDSLLKLFCGPLKKIFSTTELIQPNISCEQIHHLLQLYYLCMVPMENHTDTEPENYIEPTTNHIIQMEPEQQVNGVLHSSWHHLFSPYDLYCQNNATTGNLSEGNKISCVTELHEAGVIFREKKNAHDMFDITFKNGVMEIPFLKVEDTHKVILWNMLAFEQSQLQSYKKQILSSYLALMDSLINTEKDITILERAGVIENYLHSNEYAAVLFNQFAKSFVLDYSNHYFKKLFQEVKKYSNSTWHKNRARLKHDYFSNPWATISVLAAGILLLLTAAQTYYSSKSAK